jgi:hypothetical protein
MIILFTHCQFATNGISLKYIHAAASTLSLTGGNADCGKALPQRGDVFRHFISQQHRFGF